jgi:hypothetical protein
MRVATLPNACFAVLLIALPGWTQLPKPAVPEGRIPLPTEWRRAVEALRQAKPMPAPTHQTGFRPITRPEGLRQFDPLTGVTHSLAEQSDASIRERRVEGVPAVKPSSRGSALPADIPQVRPEGVSQPDSGGAGTNALATPPGPYYFPYTFPYTAVFKLVGRWVVNGTNYYWACSASSASSFHLFTAGHCLYNHDPTGQGSGQGAGWAVEMWAWPAQTDVVDPLDHSRWQDWPYGIAASTLFTTYNAWIVNSDLNWDIGWITLDRRIGDHVGWMGREWDTQTTALNFNGYPLQAPYVPADNPFQYPGFDANNVSGYTCCRIDMTAYVYGGHSGGPAWRFDGTNQWIQGVNSTSNRSGSATATRHRSQIEADLQNTIVTDQAVRLPIDRAQPIEYAFNDSSKMLKQTTVAIGDSFGMLLSAFNAGYTAAGDMSADVYLTTDPNDFSIGYYIGTHDFGNVGTFEFAIQNGSLAVPLHVPPRSYYVGYVLGAANPYYGNDRNLAVITDQTLNVYCAADGFETDDNSTLAKQLPPGTQNHTICGPTDQDWVYFNVSQPSGISLSTAGSAGDTTLTLYDSQLRQMAFNDDAGQSYFSAITRTCGTDGLPAGQYFAKVESHDGATVVPAYSLNLSLSSCAAVLTTLSVPKSVVGGRKITATVALASAAPAGGATILLSSNKAAATVPKSVTVPAGATTATFVIDTFPVAVATEVTISGCYNDITRTATFTVVPPSAESLSLSANPVDGGNISIGTVRLNGPAPAGGTVVELSSPNLVSFLPQSVTVPAGATSAVFEINTRRVLIRRTSVVSATAGGVTVKANLTVEPLRAVTGP